MKTSTRFIRRGLMALCSAVAVMCSSTGPASAIIDTFPADPTPLADASARIILGDMVCTATLIAPEYLITARHCLGAGHQSYISIGRNHQGEIRYASQVILNPHTDLALIKLNQPSTHAPVALSGLNLAPKARGTIVGWGGVENNFFAPVQQSQVTIQRRVINVPSPEPQLVFLEAWLDRGRIQHGDSGGPLFVDGKLAAVAAMSDAGAGTSVNGTIGWYVPVAENLAWIAKYAHIAAPAPIGRPSPLIDATRFPTAARKPAPPSLAAIVLSIFPGLPYIPAISS